MVQLGPAAPAPLLAPRLRAGARRGRAARLRVNPSTALWIVIVAILVLPIAVFLLVAISPAALGQGPEAFSLAGFGRALQGPTLLGFADSLGVGLVAALAATAVGFATAWVVLRTDAPGRRIATGLMFALFLTPSYLIALGWERLLEPNGVLESIGIDASAPRSLFYGPVGVVVVLAVKGLPFAYLAIGNALRGLGREYEEAIRVHGGGRTDAVRMVVSLLAPAVWSSLAIVFAESVSDFGVASTLANTAHFPVATFALYNAVEAFPVDFPLASAISWLLLLFVVLALVLQNAALRGRRFRVLGGRSRAARTAALTPAARTAWLVGFPVLMLVCVGIPAFGAVSASLIDGLGTLSGTHRWDLANYARVLQSPDLGGPLLYSAGFALVTATAALVLATACARVLANRGTSVAARVLDSVLLAAVALPGIVFAAGYIFAYNLPAISATGLRLYGTSTLLVLAYLATALPSTTRMLVGAVGQVQESMSDAARTHGFGPVRTWIHVGVPVLARPLLSAWLLTYAATLLELPVSQLLTPAGEQPISVGITNALARYDFGGGTAMEVLAILSALAVVAIAYGGFRLLAPRGWRRMGVAR